MAVRFLALLSQARIMIDHFTQALPLVALIAAACAFLGWSMHGVVNKPTPAKSAKATKPNPAAEKADRAKNLENALEAAKGTNKSLKSELETLRNTTVAKETFDAINAELEASRQQQDTTDKRTAALEVELKKAQDTIRVWNARTNEADKSQKSRTFALENELSKAREQLALLNEQPDDSAALHAEIVRLRESVATTTRFAGELRKREAAALEALEKAEARIADLASGPRPAGPASRKLGPVRDSDRTAAAKAEVLRLVEMNQRKQAEERAAQTEDAPPTMVEGTPALPVEVPQMPAVVAQQPAAAQPQAEPVHAPVTELPAELEESPLGEQPSPADTSDTVGEVSPTDAPTEVDAPAVELASDIEQEPTAKRSDNDLLSYD